MRFSYAEALTHPDYYVPLAQAAEAAGYHSMTIPDSLIYPRDSDTRYPYTADGDRSFLDDKEMLETLILVTHLAAVTTTLRFTPFVLKLPIRPPVLTAKQAASVAVLSGNRLGLGVGLSPWPEDFAALGVPWAERGRRTDECIDIIRGLTAGGYFAYDGEFYQLAPIKQTPVPTTPIPILVGGHADGALRRAVVRGDGWMHAGGDPAELDRMLERLAQIRTEHEDHRADFEIHVISVDAYSPDGVRRLEDRGVTDCIVGFRDPYHAGPDTQPLSAKIAALEQFAEQVIHRVEGRRGAGP